MVGATDSPADLRQRPFSSVGAGALDSPSAERSGDRPLRAPPPRARARSAEHCSASSCVGFADQWSALRGTSRHSAPTFRPRRRGWRPRQPVCGAIRGSLPTRPAAPRRYPRPPEPNPRIPLARAARLWYNIPERTTRPPEPFPGADGRRRWDAALDHRQGRHRQNGGHLSGAPPLRGAGGEPADAAGARAVQPRGRTGALRRLRRRSVPHGGGAELHRPGPAHGPGARGPGRPAAGQGRAASVHGPGPGHCGAAPADLRRGPAESRAAEHAAAGGGRAEERLRGARGTERGGGALQRRAGPEAAGHGSDPLGLRRGGLQRPCRPLGPAEPAGPADRRGGHGTGGGRRRSSP